jgi:DNA polymerase-1
VRKEKVKPPEEIMFDDLAYAQFNLIRSWVLPRCGFQNSFIQTGLEADDLMARVALDYRDLEMTIVTTDTDLYQVLNGNCAMYSPRSKKLFTAEDFKKEWGLPPYQWATILSIAGCDTDEVEGLERVGKITAAKFLRGELKGSTKACQAIMSEKGKEIASRNADLVKLPHINTNYVSLKGFDTLNMAGFLDVFNKFGFQSFLKHAEVQIWRKAMRM